MEVQKPQFSLTLSPEPFCTFCLRASPPNEELYKYIEGEFVELRLSLESLLGYDLLQLDSFAICKPCWGLMQLFQDFRTRCQKASGLVERIGHGLTSEGDGDWFGEKNLSTIEGLQKAVQGQLAQIELFNAGVVGNVKTEPVEIEGKVVESSQQLEQDKKNDFPAPAFHMVEIKVEHNDEAWDEARVEPKNEILQEIKQESPVSFDESDEIDEEINAEANDGDESESNQVPGLAECEKCHRKFAKLKSMKLHLLSCSGTQRSRLYTCDRCQASFVERRLLQAHLNKHEGKTPFPCRKHCTASFISAQIRNRHELTCGNDRQKCTLCEEVLADRMRLFAHYRLAHPGELRYPCATCGKRFRRRNALVEHERRLHTENRTKTEPCPVCGKMFAELNDLKGHMKVMHAHPGGSSARLVQCEWCGKQFRKQNSLNIHMAAAHPEQTSAVHLEAYRRKCRHNMEKKRRLKLEKMGL